MQNGAVKLNPDQYDRWLQGDTGCYFNAMNSVHFCSIMPRSNQMHYFI